MRSCLYGAVYLCCIIVSYILQEQNPTEIIPVFARKNKKDARVYM